jgi:membrane protease YdiL (CAAX protease family)
MIENKSRPPLKVIGYTLATLTLGMSFTLYLSRFHFNALYGSPEMIKHIFFYEALAVIGLSIVVIKFYSWKEVRFTIPKIKNLLWLAPITLPLILGYVMFTQLVLTSVPTNQQYTNLFIIGGTTLLVGMSEELMFRGLLLNILAQKTTLQKSILFSAIAFSVFHIINLISGISIIALPFQLLNAFVAGFGLACLSTKLESIIPLIIWHWLWDFLALGSASLEITISPLIFIGNLMIQIFLGILIWGQLKNKNLKS